MLNKIEHKAISNVKYLKKESMGNSMDHYLFDFPNGKKVNIKVHRETKDIKCDCRDCSIKLLERCSYRKAYKIYTLLKRLRK